MKTISLARGAAAALRHRFLGSRTPVSVYLYLTEACPGKCLYCGYPSRSPDRRSELSTDEWRSLIDQMLAAGARKFQFTGGEPMLRADLGSLIDRARSGGGVVGVSTSGQSVPARAEELRGADVVMLSLDGPPEVHDALRGQGAYERVIAASEALHAVGVRIWTTTVINRHTVGTLDAVIEIAERRGHVANFVLGLAEDPVGAKPTVFIDTEAGRDYALPAERVREVFRWLIAEKGRGRPIGSSVAYLEYVLGWPDYGRAKLPASHRGIPCLAGRLYAHVDHRGSIFPCGSLFWETEGTSALTIGFREAFLRASDRPCNACLYACNIEQNLLFSLEPRTVLGWAREILGR